MDKTEKNIIHRIKRIEGQVHGVRIMIERGDPFEKVETQLSAIQSAIQSLRREKFKHYAMQHLQMLDEGNDRGQREEAIKKIARYLK